MTTAELKKNLIQKIDNLEDSNTLEILDTFLENLNAEIPQLEEWQLKRIEESQLQIKNGEFHTEEEANRLTKKWFEGK